MITLPLAILILAPPQITHAAEKNSNSNGGYISFSAPKAKGASFATDAQAEIPQGNRMHSLSTPHIPIARPSSPAGKQEASQAKRLYGNIKNKASQAESPYGKDQKAADKIWKKYRALAGGQDQAAPKPATIPIRKIKHPKIKQQETPAAQSGLLGILSQYQANKQKRSQMHSLTIAKPAVEKEGDTKPEPREEE